MNGDSYRIQTDLGMMLYASASIINLRPGFLEDNLQLLRLNVASLNDKPVYILRQRGYHEADHLLEGVRKMAEEEYGSNNIGSARNRLLNKIDLDFAKGTLN